MTPAVLLHGFLGRGADWGPVALRLGETRVVLAPDLPGHGADTLPEGLPGVPETDPRHREANTRHREANTRHRDDDTRLRGDDTRLRGTDTRRRETDTRRRASDTRRREAGTRLRDGNTDLRDRTTGQGDDDAEPFDTPAPRPGGLAEVADRLAVGLDAAGVGAVDVAGYSMGGRLALLFALRYPASVRRLVLVSASPGLRTPEERAARRDSDAALARDLVADFPAFLDRWTRQPLFASLTDAQRERLVAGRLAHGRPEALARALVGMGTGAMPSLWEPLRTLGVETHAVAGALDPKYVALAISPQMVAAGVRGHVLPGAGHNLLAEAPADLADLLLRLLA